MRVVLAHCHSILSDRQPTVVAYTFSSSHCNQPHTPCHQLGLGLRRSTREGTLRDGVGATGKQPLKHQATSERIDQDYKLVNLFWVWIFLLG